MWHRVYEKALLCFGIFFFFVLFFIVRGHHLGDQNQGCVFQKNQCMKGKGVVDSLGKDDKKAQTIWKHLKANVGNRIS